MTTIYDIPELAAGGGRSLVRIPPGVDVPLTPRVRRLIDTPAFRRLAQISQLGLVSLVYPAANHSRQEHSLGVYPGGDRVSRSAGGRRAIRRRRSRRPTPSCFWRPRCCTTSATGRSAIRSKTCGLPQRAGPRSCWRDGSSRRAKWPTALRDDWGLEPADVAELDRRQRANDRDARLLRSMLSGPIDVDKIDYLMRDSLHAGVPYGRHFDRAAADRQLVPERGRRRAWRSPTRARRPPR